MPLIPGEIRPAWNRDRWSVVLVALALILTCLVVDTSAFDCAEVDSELAVTWQHPNASVSAVLCRWDPFPGWSESLWIVKAAGQATRVALYGSGVDTFRWLDCGSGRVVMHVVDSTHMGTVTASVRELLDGQVVELYSVTRPPARLSRELVVPVPERACALTRWS